MYYFPELESKAVLPSKMNFLKGFVPYLYLKNIIH